MKLKISNIINFYSIAFLLIILFGFFLRIQGVLTNSFAFTYDVGRDMLALQLIVNDLDIPFLGPTTGIPGLYYGPWWYYLLTPFFFIFGGDSQGIAFVMVMLGVATIALSYYLGLKIGGKFIGLCFAVIISVSHVMISLSSQIWNPNIAPLFVILVFILLTKIYSDKKTSPITYLFLGVLLSLCVDIEIFFGIFFTIGIVLSIVFIKKLKFSVKEILLFILGNLIILLPRILFELKNHYLLTRSLILFFELKSQKKEFIETFMNRINVFLNHFSSTITGGDRNIGIGLIILIFIVLFFLYKKATHLEKNFITTSAVVFASFFLGTAFFGDDIWPHYLVGLPILFILVFMISLDLITKKFKLFIGCLIIIAIFLINFNPVQYSIDLQKPLWEGDAAVYRNQLAVIDYIYSEADGRRFKYVVFTPVAHDYTYRYLFSWYGPKKYGFKPSLRADTAYFILEPDHQHPLRLRDWLIDRAGDGKVVKSEVIKGGITVQTRKVD